MNVYDTANQLASEIKKSEEYVNYKMAKEVIGMKPELNEKINEFESSRYETQLVALQNGKNDEEKVKQMQQLYLELIQNPEVQSFFEAETKFNVLLADVNRIIGEAVKDIL